MKTCTYSVDDCPSSVSQWMVAACISNNYLAIYVAIATYAYNKIYI